MVTPAIPAKRAEQFIELVEEKLRQGHTPRGLMPRRGERSAIRAACDDLGLPTGSVTSHYEACVLVVGREPDWSLWKDPRMAVYEQIHTPKPKGKPVFRVRMHRQDEPEGPSYRVLVIGDAHDSPHIPDKSRFTWIGAYANEHKIPYIRQIGDWGTFDSCSQWDDYGRVDGYLKPSFQADLDSLEESTVAFRNAFDKGYDPDCETTEGNHENRVYQWENQHPEVEGLFIRQMEQAFGRARFRTVRYGEWSFLGGVGFTHVPFNIMGKPYGGKYPENQIANDAMFSVVFGHTHKRNCLPRPKIGPQKRITVLNVGSALPHGHVERYVLQSTTGWSHGVYDILIRGGDIVAEKFISMLELRDRYG